MGFTRDLIYGRMLWIHDALLTYRRLCEELREAKQKQAQVLYELDEQSKLVAETHARAVRAYHETTQAMHNAAELSKAFELVPARLMLARLSERLDALEHKANGERWHLVPRYWECPQCGKQLSEATDSPYGSHCSACTRKGF